MGNYKMFRFSDMIPNAWINKLKYITKTRTPNQSKTTTAPPQPPPHHRRSYHLTRELIIKSPDPTRKSSKKRRSIRRAPSVRQSPKLVANCSCQSNVTSIWTKPDSTPEDYPNSSLDSLSEKEMNPERPAMTDVSSKGVPSKFENLNGFDFISERVLPPIITKPKKNDQETVIINKEQRRKNARGFSVNSPGGVKLKAISPRIRSGRKSLSRRGISESVAVVKRSENPERDFKESMVEMIIENNIRTSKDLEDLLACYLSLNSDQHHHVIIKVFKQIWFDVTDVRLK